MLVAGQPNAKSEPNSRSRLQAPEPFSSVEYLDWLVPIMSATSFWVRSEAERVSFSSFPRVRRSSTCAASLGVSPKS